MKRIAYAACATLCLGGCVVTTAVGTAVDATTTVVGGAVDVTVGAVETVADAATD
ncbi:hypothetical protein G5B40_03555 [Pikeienuella piscinae]|uniref:Lipoprotein n=1 Tax=Pikeienuella piscinae TaxID=2748098 RepID=A0A7L5BXH4_9RHOB|nr:hypothetical protein [Pikeienuella piscinae]QIE54594.1 hypothetical protein G5B40_03555 [Pikeienuella piscinae]